MQSDCLNAHGPKQFEQARPFCAPAVPPHFHLGVLFIHGIGAQKRGQTLAEFGAPVYAWVKDRLNGLDRRWREAINQEALAAIKQHAEAAKQQAPEIVKQQILEATPELVKRQTLLEQWRNQVEDWATDGFHADDRRLGAWVEPDADQLIQLAERVKSDTVVGRVSLADALVDDASDRSAPAHAELRIQRLRIDGSLEVESWLMAEAWWAETFIPPRFTELAGWGLRIIPWTIGNYFGAHIRRVLGRRPEPPHRGSWKEAIRWLLWAASLPAPFLGLVFGLLVSPFLLAVIVVLLLVWLLPIPQIREALLKFQRIISSTLGDSYVLVTHPIEAASIVGQVRRDIAWLAARCNVVAIVAHSQGGAIAHTALQREVPSKLGLLFTFGSGLKKLEQLKYLLSSGHSYLRSAIFTLIALPIFGFVLLWFAMLPVMYRPAEASELLGRIPIMVAVLAMSATFLLAGLRDYFGGVDVADLQRWTKRLTNMSSVDWVDCFAGADPVSDGILIEDPTVEDLSKEICNEASVLRDHTSYWTNRDQFVTLFVDRLMRPELRKEASISPAPELATDQSRLDWIGARRRVRVGVLRAIRWIGIVSVLLVAYQEHPSWQHLVGDLAEQTAGWIKRSLDGGGNSASNFTLPWLALSYLVLVLGLYWIARRRWQTWNEVEMRAIVQGGGPIENLSVPLLMSVQLLAAAILVYRGIPPFSIVMIALIGPVAARTILELSISGKVEHLEARSSSEDQQSHADQIVTLIGRILPLFYLPFSAGLLGWELFTWVVGYFGGSIFGFRPGEVSSVVVGVLVALSFWGGALVWVRFRRGSWLKVFYR